MKRPRSWSGQGIRAALALALMSLAAPAAAEESLGIPVVRFTLDNGLRVVLSPEDSAAVVSVAVYYDVGSRNETPGRSGFAHLFEHMMFEGSGHVAGAEHSRLINAAGGWDNGSTSSDRTNYYEVMPSHQLILALWLEADRMRSLSVTPENFENQRRIVINEYRQSYENQPYGLAGIRINALAYGDYFPYANPTIGSIEDLRRATFEEARSFYQSWYGPNNAVLGVVGDIDVETTRARIERLFGDIPARPTPAWTDPGLPAQQAERFEVMYDRLAPLPAFYESYHIPASRQPDHYALVMLVVILGQGRSSRLHRLLVEQEQVLTRVNAYTAGRRGPDQLRFDGVLAAGHRPEEARRLLYQAVEQVQREGVTDHEMAKARNRVRSFYVFSLQTGNDRVQNLAEFEMIYGDAGLLNTEIGRYLEVTAGQVRDVSRRYLTPENRSHLVVMPGEPHGEGEPTDGPDEPDQVVDGQQEGS